MIGQYFPAHKDGNSIDVNLNLSGYATKDDLKNLNVDTSSFALKKNLSDLKIKVDTIDSSKNTFETGISKLVSVTFFNSINLSIASLRSINNTEIN